MSFDYDATGIDMDQQFSNKLLPKGTYDFEIIEFVSKAGKQYPLEGYTKENNYPKVDLLVEVTTPGEFEGERLFHSVTFIPKGKPGEGMALHFLKAIGQPYEGKLTVDASQWVGGEFVGYVIEDEYQGKKRNKISQVIAKTKSDALPF